MRSVGRTDLIWLGRLAVAVVVLTSWMMHSVASAEAAEYTMRPCDNWNILPEWQIITDSSGSNLADRCPFEMELSNPITTQPGEETIWFFDGRSKVRTAEIVARGSDGSDSGRVQGFALCNSWGDCGPIVGLSGASENESEVVHLNAEDPSVPEGVTGVAIIASCPADGPECLPGKGFKINSIAATFVDDTPPVIEVNLTDPTPESVGAFGRWFASPLRYSWSAIDEQSGVKRAFFRTSGKTHEYQMNDCFDPISEVLTDICGELGRAQGAAEITGLEQGESNGVLVRAVNGAGITGETTMPLNVDTRPPQRPGNLRVVGANAQGWVRSNVVELEWSNYREDEEDRTNSGVVKARYGIENYEISTVVDVSSADRRRMKITMPDNQDAIWPLNVSTIDRVGNESQPRDLTVKVDQGTPSAPELAPIPKVNGANVGDVVIKWKAPEFTPAAQWVSGVCGYVISATSFANSDPGTVINHPAELTERPADQILDAGSRYVHLRAVSCAGAPGAISHQPVMIDLVPPTLSAQPSTPNWRRGDGDLTILASDEGSGVFGIEYAVDGGPQKTVNHRSVTIKLAGGRHNISFLATDVAGNRSAEQTLVQNVDDAAPGAWFEQRNPTRPTEITAQAVDGDSGLTGAWIEYQRVGESEPWLPLGDRFSAAIGQPVATLTARFPDDESIPPGTYKIRIVAVDAVGNITLASAHLGGGEALVTTPLRSESSMDASMVHRAKKTGGLVAYGQSPQIAGRLVDGSGGPIARVPIGVFSAPVEGGIYERIGEVMTGGSGDFRLSLPAATSRSLLFRFAGDEMHRPVKTRLAIRVKGKVNVSASHRVIKRGKAVVLSGKVHSAGGSIPLRGKQIRVQFRSHGKWSPFYTSQITDSSGLFSVPLRLNVAAVFHLRVSAPAEPGWPFESTVSRTLRVRVKR